HQLVDAFHEGGGIVVVHLEARLPVDDVLQHPGRLEFVLAGVGGGVLPGPELLQGGFFVVRVDEQQQLPDQHLGTGVLIDLHVGCEAAGVVVVGVEFAVGNVHGGGPVWGGQDNRRTAVAPCGAQPANYAHDHEPHGRS